jgi:hypothetical protein
VETAPVDRRVRALFIAVGAAFIACTVPVLASCLVHPRERVVLYGVGDDPGVFLWDSRFRLRAYHAASFDEAQALLPHALLLGGGTRAIVIRCYRNDVQPKYSLTPDDAVDVLVLSGPDRGHSGWVIGGDVRVILSRMQVRHGDHL